MNMHVILQEDGKLIVVGAKGYTPSNSIGIVPSDIEVQYYDCLRVVPIYDSVYVDKVIGQKIEKDPQLVAEKDIKDNQDKLNELKLKFNQKRLELLTKSDYTQISDYPIDSETKALWSTYRQELRDLSTGLATSSDYENVVWPTPPV